MSRISRSAHLRIRMAVTGVMEKNVGRFEIDRGETHRRWEAGVGMMCHSHGWLEELADVRKGSSLRP
jgi:hypothetical protein